jgi:hypothetical protein
MDSPHANTGSCHRTTGSHPPHQHLTSHNQVILHKPLRPVANLCSSVLLGVNGSMPLCSQLFKKQKKNQKQARITTYLRCPSLTEVKLTFEHDCSTACTASLCAPQHTPQRSAIKPGIGEHDIAFGSYRGFQCSCPPAPLLCSASTPPPTPLAERR